MARKQEIQLYNIQIETRKPDAHGCSLFRFEGVQEVKKTPGWIEVIEFIGKSTSIPTDHIVEVEQTPWVPRD